MRTILFRLHGKRFRHLKFEKKRKYLLGCKENKHNLNLNLIEKL